MMFSTDDQACLQKLDCSICDFPPYQFHNFPEAVNLMCWNNCAPRSGVSSMVEHQNSELEKTDASDVFELSVRSMVRDKSLTMADIAWYADDPTQQHQCLVSWEIFGGGIMGNLLTDTHEAELSLWPDSKYHIQVTCKNKNTHKMSKSLPILIDTTMAFTKTTTKSSSESDLRRRPEANGASIEKGKYLAENERPPLSPSSSSSSSSASLQPHTKATKTTTASTAQANNDYNHETEAIASIIRHQNYQKQHEYNNDYQITAKPLYNAHHQMKVHAAASAAAGGDDDDVGIVEKAGKNSDKVNSVHDTLTTSRDAAKLSKTLPSSSVTKITHTDIETMLTVFGVFVLVVTLVICTIVSVKQRIKSNKKYCDKTNLISSNSSCSSTTSINDCEMDFNGSTTSIEQMTAIHV
ncbi:uncharacterized protein LOC116343446 [Contarinia nasturtii]|uniref:uncharacterized protein LOC116343446 n=1 Tax=Contarinia nasturtii TaxID=265458 RepID=UPI0012D3AD05|nr:uncharacterized protein LOC116343446 [Contarinia nasturtii]